MIQKLKHKISVILSFDASTCQVIPRKLVWQGQLHVITKIGLHHTYRTGRTLFHVFSVQTSTLFFRIVFNTDNLHWTLEEIADGLPD